MTLFQPPEPKSNIRPVGSSKTNKSTGGAKTTSSSCRALIDRGLIGIMICLKTKIASIKAKIRVIGKNVFFESLNIIADIIIVEYRSSEERK